MSKFQHINNADIETEATVDKNETKKKQPQNNKKTFFGLLAVSALIIAASTIYTKKEIEKLDNNEK